MKKSLWIAITLFLMAGASMAAERIVFIDLERVFDEFYKTQLAKSKIAVQQKDIDVERQSMVDEMTAISKEVDTLKKEARDSTLSQEIRDGKRILYEERLLELRDKQKEINEFIERRKKQVQMQVARMSQTIMDEIRLSVIEYAKQEGLQAVIDNSTRGAAVGVFIYTHPDVDITDSVLALLNSKRPDILDGGDLLDNETSVDAPKEKTSAEQ